MIAPAFYIAGMDEPLLVQSFFILRFLSGRDSVQSHHPKHLRHRSHLLGVLETFSTVTLHGAGCFVSKAMARICISAKSIFPPVVGKMLMVAGAYPALVSSLLIHGDQFRVVRCLAFGLPVPHSLRSGQICVLLCNSVTVPVRHVALCLRVHHQVSGPVFSSRLTVQIGTLLHPHGLLQVMDSRLTVMPLT